MARGGSPSTPGVAGCEACRGDGLLKIEMHFLHDIYVPCEVCKGKRYNRETLEVTYKGREHLRGAGDDGGRGPALLRNLPRIYNRLKTLEEVGLGYVKLGQASTTLSGGEAQRVKLATELSKRSTGKTIYNLDEPTTGLHSYDVQRLIDVLQKLGDAGKHCGGHRAQPGRHQDRRQSHRPGPRGGRRGRRHRVCGNSRRSGTV